MIKLQFQDRPNIAEKHDEVHDLKMARYALSVGANNQWDDWVNNTNVNAHFFFDDQWIHPEDKDAFFKDENDNASNRIKVVKNFIKPTVTQYLGNARIMDLQFEAKSISQKSITRKEKALQEARFLTNVANVATPELKQSIKDKYLIGDNINETDAIFENAWVDEYVEAINAYLRKVASDNDFEEMRVSHAFDNAISGLCAAEYLVINRQFKWDHCYPGEVFWDRSAKQADFQDGEFMGRIKEYLPSEILEYWKDIKEEDRKAIKKATTDLNISEEYSGRIPVVRVYYRTSEKITFGYVKDEDGIFAWQLNDPNVEESKRYTEKDLVPVSELSEADLRYFNGSNQASIEPEIIRFVEFIPSEIIPSGSRNHVFESNDIVLDSGIYPWADTEYNNPIQALFPIKVSPWMHYKGYVDTPISSLINPQRMINRYESAKEQHINSHTGQTTFIDQWAVDMSDKDMSDVQADMKAGRPVALNAKGRGLNNVVANIGMNLSADNSAYIAVKEDMKRDMDQMTGVNESLRGTNQGQNKLVGVMEQEIQRASLIQEPFYGAIARLYKQMYQATANVGKRVAIRYQHNLIMDVGEQYAKTLTLSEDMDLEDFRVVLKRVPDRAKQVEQINNIIPQLEQLGYIDRTQAADLYGRSTMEDVSRAIRKKAKQDVIAAREQAKQEGLLAEQAAANEQANQARMENRDDMKTLIEVDQKEKDRQLQREVAGTSQKQ